MHGAKVSQKSLELWRPLKEAPMMHVKRIEAQIAPITQQIPLAMRNYPEETRRQQRINLNSPQMRRGIRRRQMRQSLKPPTHNEHSMAAIRIKTSVQFTTTSPHRNKILTCGKRSRRCRATLAMNGNVSVRNSGFRSKCVASGLARNAPPPRWFP